MFHGFSLVLRDCVLFFGFVDRYFLNWKIEELDFQGLRCSDFPHSISVF